MTKKYIRRKQNMIYEQFFSIVNKPGLVAKINAMESVHKENSYLISITVVEAMDEDCVVAFKGKTFPNSVPYMEAVKYLWERCLGDLE
jgi:hypothetical protein